MYPIPINALFLQQGARQAGIRPAAFSDVPTEYDALVHHAGVIDRSDMTKLVISGDDRAEWLQGQVTNDVRTLRPGGVLDALVCFPAGQILADCRIWDLGDRYVLLAPGSRRRALRERLESMVILEDVTIGDLTDSHALLSVVGPGASGDWLDGFRFAPTNALRLPGLDVLLTEDETATFAVRLAELAMPVGTTAYEIARIEDAIPVYGADITERTLPQEMGPLFAERHLSFAKGCYVGQETIMRIRSRGHTNRTWVGILGHDEVGAGIPVRAEPASPTIGTITSACRSLALDQPIALAMVRNAFGEPRTELDVGRVVDLPFVAR
jgi:folate-binding protein YgfZ